MTSGRSFPTIAAVAVAVASVGAISTTRQRLVADLGRVREVRDVYALPSANQTVALSLGYRDALADYLFAHVLVSYGIHVHAHERFEFAGNYIDVVNALAPTFRTPYQLADTILTLQATAPPVGNYVKAREILERGTRALPYDGDVWLTAGQFVAYLGPGHVGGPHQDDEWRRAGARMLARACELVGTNEALPYQCITAAAILSEQGYREAVIRMLERYVAVNQQNPELPEFALKFLGKLGDQKRMAQAQERLERFRTRWRSDLPFVSLDTELVLPPPFDPFACAGQGVGSDAQRRDTAECATSWRSWFALTNR